VEWQSCMSVDPWLDRLGGAWSSRMEIVCACVWVSTLAGLRSTGLWSEYFAGLCRLWGAGPAEWRSCVFVSQVWHA
jgi:hypothetical protein